MYNFSPYFTSSMLSNQIPFSLPGTTAGLASMATKKFSWSSLFNGIQKTVGTVNQIIPLYQNVKPIITNSKTLFKVMRSLNSSGPLNSSNNTINTNQKIETPESIVIEKKEEEELVELVSKNTPPKPFFN